ncbi:MAG: hypothetical protein QOH88_1944 [Verrucomicrobiota bacterium]|jgi:hypothetical protein
MPIQISDFPDPLTPAAKESSAERVLIESVEYRQLVHELRSYCNAEISGRSFLIAGHRGSGKTTLTLSAFEKVWRQAKEGRLRMRPLLVQLLGPSLLPEFDERDVAEPTRGAADAQKTLTEFENVLVQFTLALHRAVVNELSEAYGERMKDLAGEAKRGGRFAVEQTNAFLEAPGQLALELDEYPGKARLREFWQRARALPQGLLRLPPRPSEKPEVSNQGINELVALCSVSEAYRRISGTIQASNKDEAAAKDASARTRETELKGKELFGPVITLLTGGIVASGVAAISPGRWALAAIAGLLTVLSSAVVAKYSITRSQERSSSREELFLPNLSVATLDRVLPVLLDRVRDAGLAPIFIIDELDKVEDLSERIPKMVKRLKKLVAEKAFFCFLTDRRYFEEMSSRNAEKPHSVESTYFSNQAFITFRHTDFHWFLGELLKQISEPSSPPRPSPAGASPSVGLDEEMVDHALLPFIVLHVAQMHPIDLRRVVSSYRGENKTVSLTPGQLRSNLNRLRVMVQVAIECLLESTEMELELERDPTFRRLAHDALYFISREWQQGAGELRLDDEGRKKFEDYLGKRMMTEQAGAALGTEPVPMHSGTNDRAKRQQEREVKSLFTEDEADFLWKKVRELANLLAQPPLEIHNEAVARNARSDRWPSGRFPSPVLDAIISMPACLLVRAGEAEVFHFRYSRAGRVPELREDRTTAEGRVPFTDSRSSLKPKSDEAPLRRKIGLIKKFNSVLGETTENSINFGTLGASFGVIRTSPAWPSVEAALARLEGPSKDYSEKDEDVSNVDQFAELLKSSASTIALAFFCGWVVGSAGTDEETKGREVAGLQTLSLALGWKKVGEEKVKRQVQEFADGLFKRLRISKKPEEPNVNSVSGIERWKDYLAVLKRRAKPFLKEALQVSSSTTAKAWEFWRARIQQPDLPANFEAVICAATGVGPSQVLHFPPEEMSARAWSNAFYEVGFRTTRPLASSGPVGESRAGWLTVAALRQLGFVVDPHALFAMRLLNATEAMVSSAEGFEASAMRSEQQPNAVIITKEGSELEKWKRPNERAVLVLQRPELDPLTTWEYRDRLFHLMRLEWVVFDWSSWPEVISNSSPRIDTLPFVTPGELEWAQNVIRFFSAAASFRIPAIVPRDWTGELPGRFFAIAAPNSFDELFTIIARERTRSPLPP